MHGKLVFLGTGTSSGVPVIGCDCAVCTSTDVRDNRLRTSAYLHFENDTRLLLDCGTDFRQQALRQDIRHLDGILISHAHQDHIGGIDELRQLNFLMKRDLAVYGNTDSMAELQARFDYIFKYSQEGGGKPRLSLNIVSGSFEIAGISIEALPVMHGALSIYGYRIGSMAYITDASALPDTSLKALAGLDVLVINALRPKAHPTHFNLEQTLAVIAQVKPQRAFLVHMTHDILHARDNPLLPAGVEFAYDGLRVEF